MELLYRGIVSFSNFALLQGYNKKSAHFGTLRICGSSLSNSDQISVD